MGVAKSSGCSDETPMGFITKHTNVHQFYWKHCSLGYPEVAGADRRKGSACLFWRTTFGYFGGFLMLEMELRCSKCIWTDKIDFPGRWSNGRWWRFTSYIIPISGVGKWSAGPRWDGWVPQAYINDCSKTKSGWKRAFCPQRDVGAKKVPRSSWNRNFAVASVNTIKAGSKIICLSSESRRTQEWRVITIFP